MLIQSRLVSGLNLDHWGYKVAFQSLEKVLGKWEARQEGQLSYQFRHVLQAWSAVVGPAVAVQTKPLVIQNQVLRVATSSSAWSQTLTFERQRILAKLNQQLNVPLTDISFTPGQWHTAQRHQKLFLDSQQTSLWQSHSSRTANSSIIFSNLPADPQSAFQRWAKAMQARSQSLPLCPQCHCPTPPQELERWSVCALCAAKQW
jgi:predicted nucleic acid-binding Zn ribbon protein